MGYALSVKLLQEMLKIPKGKQVAVIRSRTNNTMAKRKKDKLTKNYRLSNTNPTKNGAANSCTVDKYHLILPITLFIV
jgi:hypothetical protein